MSETTRNLMRSNPIESTPNFHGRICYAPSELSDPSAEMSYNSYFNKIKIGKGALLFDNFQLQESLGHEKAHQIFSELDKKDQLYIVTDLMQNNLEDLKEFYSVIKIGYGDWFRAEKCFADVIRNEKIGRGNRIFAPAKILPDEVIDISSVIEELLAFSTIVPSVYYSADQIKRLNIDDSNFYNIVVSMAKQTIHSLNPKIYGFLNEKGFYSIDKHSLLIELLSDEKFVEDRVKIMKLMAKAGMQ